MSLNTLVTGDFADYILHMLKSKVAFSGAHTHTKAHQSPFNSFKMNSI